MLSATVGQQCKMHSIRIIYIAFIYRLEEREKNESKTHSIDCFVDILSVLHEFVAFEP